MAFDRGDGGKPARKLLESGVYRFGLDSGRKRLDLFPAKDDELTEKNTTISLHLAG